MAVAAHFMPNKPMPNGPQSDKKEKNKPDNTQALMLA
jgi:hypothetical protein